MSLDRSDAPTTRSRLRWCTHLAAAVALLVALPLSAQEGVSAKIVVIDLERVFAASPPGSSLKETLTSLSTTAQQELDGLNATLQELASRTPTSAADQLQIQRQQEDTQLQIRRVQDDARRRAASAEQEKRAEFEELLAPILERMQNAEGWDLILNRNPAVVVFATSAVDVTERVLEQLNGPG